MFRNLDIRNFVIVDHLELEFDPGFTVFTGETGAGKSILVDALAFVLGGRAEAGLVRSGADRAEVAAGFDLPQDSALHAWLAENDLEAGDEVLLRRTVDAGGRSRAWVNGRAATVQQLRFAGEHLAEIHGQHAHHSLLRAETQRGLLDGFAGLADEAAAVARAWQQWNALRQQREQFAQDADALTRERAQLEAERDDLRELSFSGERWGDTLTEQRRLANTSALVEGVAFGMDALSEGDGAAMHAVNTVSQRLSEIAEFDPRLRDILGVVESARVELQEAVYALRAYARGIDEDPGLLAELEAYMAQVNACARKHRLSVDAIPERLAQLDSRLATLEAIGSGEALAAREAAARAEFDKRARALSKARKRAAEGFAAAVTETIRTLSMPDGRFEVALVPLPEGGSGGYEQVEFQVASHASLASGTLARVASGGELARISLAIQVVASAVTGVPTLVFDEVDTGIGGRVAEIVGRQLARLGRQRQIMCVTHLPQVAACADQHWSVSKDVSSGMPASRLAALDRRARVDEIARMLGGVEITATTRRHAQEMLARGAAVDGTV